MLSNLLLFFPASSLIDLCTEPTILEIFQFFKKLQDIKVPEVAFLLSHVKQTKSVNLSNQGSDFHQIFNIGPVKLTKDIKTGFT